MREGKDMRMGLLLDFYEPLMTEKQSELLRNYYDLDLSLSELAEDTGVSRQAVQFALKKAEKKLLSFEEKLRLRERYEASQALIDAFEAGKETAALVEDLKKAWED